MTTDPTQEQLDRIETKLDKLIQYVEKYQPLIDRAQGMMNNPLAGLLGRVKR